MIRIVRWLLGSIILFLNWVFTPKGIKRSSAAQAEIDKKTEQLALYQYAACPFCVKVRRAMKRNSLNIQTCDAKQNDIGNELTQGGGKLKVPCLKIKNTNGEVRWLYESSDIIQYLETQIAA